MSEPNKTLTEHIDEVSGVETTGHDWDGIKELNNPLPRWWLIIFYVTIAWAVVYCIFMPSFPGLDGLRGHSDRRNVEQQVAEAANERAAIASQLLTSGRLEDIERDPALLEFALAAGKSAFGDNCATCHGVGGQGFPGYPSLADDVWLWGGSLSDIKDTITHGIRSHSPETRVSQMPAFGKQRLLSPEQISDLTTYVLAFGTPQDDAEALERAAPLYTAQCAACHREDGTGDQAQGAPNLTDREWLYGADRKQIRAQIWNGQNGVMPAWQDRLDDATIAALAVYVHTLGGGEPSVTAQSASTGTEDLK